MPNDQTGIAQLAGLRKAFLSTNTVNELAELLAISPTHLAAVAARPRYHIFDIPKKNGEKRRIEDPDDRLQAVQTGLNAYLQAVYWHQRSDAAYGFLIVPADDPSPRHILPGMIIPTCSAASVAMISSSIRKKPNFLVPKMLKRSRGCCSARAG